MDNRITQHAAQAADPGEARYELWWRHLEEIGGVCLCRLEMPEMAPGAIARFRRAVYTFPVTALVQGDGSLVRATSSPPRQYPESAGVYVVTDEAGEEYGHYQVAGGAAPACVA